MLFSKLITYGAIDGLKSKHITSSLNLLQTLVPHPRSFLHLGLCEMDKND